jgi:hypothetical protein
MTKKKEVKKEKTDKKEKAKKVEKAEDLGKDILSWCGKCKQPTNHIIVTMTKKGTVNKCECQTCKASHKYRDPENPPKPRATKRATKKGAAVELIWSEAIAEAKGPSKPYKMSAEFEQGDLIDHPSFGQGVVAELMGTNKIKAVFESSEKILACNR